MPQTRARLRVLAYAGAMLITGSINTIAVKFQVRAPGPSRRLTATSRPQQT